MMMPLARVTRRAAPGRDCSSFPGQQCHAAVNDRHEQDEREAQQPGLHRHRQRGVRADELRHQGHEEQQALGVDPADAHALQEGPELVLGTAADGAIRAEACAAPGPQGAQAQPQQVGGARDRQPAEQPRASRPAAPPGPPPGAPCAGRSRRTARPRRERSCAAAARRRSNTPSRRPGCTPRRRRQRRRRGKAGGSWWAPGAAPRGRYRKNSREYRPISVRLFTARLAGISGKIIA